MQRVTADQKLISIAHRLQTVAFYDRILAMDAGTVAEVGVPEQYS
jgi:ABC-type multidrug transport system fused ATPase/permease subunit